MDPQNTIADIVKSRINTFNEGYVFSYMDIEGASKNSEAIIKALNRLTEKGILQKLVKGKFYKPSFTDNGKHGLQLNEIVKDLAIINGYFMFRMKKHFKYIRRK